MGLFSKKPKVSMEQFCRNYYDSQIFYLPDNNSEVFQNVKDFFFKSVKDVSLKTLNWHFRLFVENQPSLSKIDPASFDRELAAMNLELFALAFFQKYVRLKRTIPQSIFTRDYLQGKSRLDIWEAMGEYNRAIAQTATMDNYGRPMVGKTGIERMTIGRVNSMRFELAYKWIEENVKDPNEPTKSEEELSECVARTLNRFEASITRKDKKGNQLITELFLQRLGFTEEGGLTLDSIVGIDGQFYSMYESAKHYLRKVDIQF